MKVILIFAIQSQCRGEGLALTLGRTHCRDWPKAQEKAATPVSNLGSWKSMDLICPWALT